MRKKPPATAPETPTNGHSVAVATPGNDGQLSERRQAPVDLVAILAALQTMRDGNFSVRLPVEVHGLPGKIADTFNEIVAANQQMAEELERVGQVVGKQGKTRERTVSTGREAPGARWRSRSILWWKIFFVLPRKSLARSPPWRRGT